MTKRKENEKIEGLLLVGVLFSILLLGFVIAADPVYPDTIAYGDNETKNASSALTVNVSGGVISNFNLSATVQNPRWKAFVGQVIGQFTLADSDGSSIYDWTLATVTGRVYATRKTTSVTWAGIGCANVANLESENTALTFSNVDDNITSTFNTTAGATHDTFNVGSETIAANTCPTLNTKVNSGLQDNFFEEMVLHDGSNLVFATILEEDQTGYNGENYDFQMIVPENESSASNTIYYLYVELGN